MTDAETAAVNVYVSELKPVRGRGNIRYEATAAIAVAGVEVVLHGLTLRAEPHGRYLPQTRCSDGIWRPALSMPPAVERAIAEAALEQTNGLIIKSPIQEPENV